MPNGIFGRQRINVSEAPAEQHNVLKLPRNDVLHYAIVAGALRCTRLKGLGSQRTRKTATEGEAAPR
jgi:hypothetical protein